MKRKTAIILPLLIILAASTRAQQADARSLELTESTYEAIRDAIAPSEAETQWQRIPWRPDLAQAIREAAATKKPILLWAMNGHPCGMT